MCPCMIGNGYVGLFSGAGFAEVRHQVTCAEEGSPTIAATGPGERPTFRSGKSICDEGLG
jgi:UDP-glucose 6-dehydrogenase